MVGGPYNTLAQAINIVARRDQREVSCLQRAVCRRLPACEKTWKSQPAESLQKGCLQESVGRRNRAKKRSKLWEVACERLPARGCVPYFGPRYDIFCLASLPLERGYKASAARNTWMPFGESVLRGPGRAGPGGTAPTFSTEVNYTLVYYRTLYLIMIPLFDNSRREADFLIMIPLFFEGGRPPDMYQVLFSLLEYKRRTRQSREVVCGR